MSLEINYDETLETRRDGIFGFCRIFFHDYELDLLKSRYEKNYSQGKNYSFHVIKSEPGKMMADNLSCMHQIIPLLYVKNRKIDLTYFAFWAHPGYVNYLGHIVINYKPSGFATADLFALGGLKNDGAGKIDVRVEDRVEDALIFLSKNYPELKNIPLTKSFLDDISKIKPSTKPEAYSPKKDLPPVAVSEVAPPATAAINSSAQNSNPYYMPKDESLTANYYNPYENQEKAVEKTGEK